MNRFKLRTVLIAFCILGSLNAFSQSIPTLKTSASFSYASMQKDPVSGLFDFAVDIWTNNESSLATVKFENQDDPVSGKRTLAGIHLTVYDKNNVARSFSTLDVPPILNASTNPNADIYKHWWSLIGFGGLTKKEIVFIFLNYVEGVSNEHHIVSYTMNTKTSTLERNNTIIVPTLTIDSVTTKLKSCWSAKNNIYYVLSSTDDASGAVTASNIYVCDSKLKKIKKQLANPNHRDIINATGPGNNSMLPMPAGYLFDDYSTTSADGNTITRNVHIYKQP